MIHMRDIDFKELVDSPESLDDFCKGMGITFDEIKPGFAVGKMELSEFVRNPLDGVHGGALFTLCDVVTGMAANATGKKITTLDANISFLAPGLFERTKFIHCTAQSIKDGKTIVVMGAKVKDDSGKLLCTATFTFYAFA